MHSTATIPRRVAGAMATILVHSSRNYGYGRASRVRADIRNGIRVCCYSFDCRENEWPGEINQETLYLIGIRRSFTISNKPSAQVNGRYFFCRLLQGTLLLCCRIRLARLFTVSFNCNLTIKHPVLWPLSVTNASTLVILPRFLKSIQIRLQIWSDLHKFGQTGQT